MRYTYTHRTIIIAGFAGALVAIILLNAIHGALTGVRQRIEDQISAAGDDVQALADIDVFVGWPGMYFVKRFTYSARAL